MLSAKRIELIVLLALFALSGAAALGQDEPGLPPGPPPPPPRPGYVLVDDMWLPSWALGAESTYLGTPWPGGNVYVILSDQFSSSQKDYIRKCWAELEAVCGVDFFEVTQSYTGDHIAVIPNTGYPNVSNSEVGMIGGQQLLRVGSSFFASYNKFALTHEFMHALGFKHEQSRPDRDSYVTILWNNISQSACNGSSCDGNFALLGSAATTYGSYDFLSIMHYSAGAFSIGETTTIQCNSAYSSFQNKIGNRKYLSNGDITGLQTKYGQPSPAVANTVVPNAVAATTASQLWITVNGQNFFEGSLDPDNGLQGSVVTVNGYVVDTTFVSENELTAILPWGFIDSPTTLQIGVWQGTQAGGPSGTVPFTVLPPPCTASADRVGHSVAGLGDVDGDGKGDYVVGLPGWGSDQGRIICYSGGTGAVLWSLNGLSTGNKVGWGLGAIGDVNGDGKKDVLLGSPGYPGTDAGRLEIRSGANGTQLTNLINGTAGESYGWAVAGLGDVEGDGDQDFAVSKPGYNNSTGRVEIWSSNGGLIRTHTGGAAGDRYGHSISGGYDLNQDGVPDYVIGAPGKVIGGLASVGRVYAYSGATGALLTSKDGDSSYDNFGYDVALIPTTGTSGPYGQILVGAPEIPNFFSGSGNGPGYVRLFHHASLLNGFAELATWTGAQVGDRYGVSVASAGDVNDDGYPDIIIGMPQSMPLYAPVGPGGFDIRSGKSPYDVIYHYQGLATDEQLGFSVDGVGDVDGDARLDVIAGSPGSDVGCIDAGAFSVIHPPVPPEILKVMITEISTGNPDCVEITNFGTSSVSINNWKVRWKDSSTTDTALSGTIAAGETIVVSETTSLPECPAGVQIITMSSVGTTLGDVAVALISNRNHTVDEVHLESSTGVYSEGSLGGLFRGVVVSQATNATEVNAERIWGLDSNGGSDWTTGAVRSMGLQNRSTGTSRGTDPIAMRYVRINETDDNADYIELYRPSPPFIPFNNSVNLQGWYLLASAGQNQAHLKLTPFPNSFTIGNGAYVVLGDGPTTPTEMPGSATYVDLAAVGGGNIPWVASEYDCALYDSYGRLVDTFRSTRPNTNLAHNHPRAPALWSEFSGVAPRGSAGAAAVGRNAGGTDTNTGADFQPLATRTMGSANNTIPTWTPDGTPPLSVVLNDNLGGGLTAILTAGGDREGQKWTMTFSIGHHNGAGPIVGYGPDLIDNWLFLSVTPPFFGFLDENGSARVDLPAGTVPPGVQADFLFILQDGPGAGAPITQLSSILEYDS